MKMEELNEKSKSKSQQRLFGMALAYKRGDIKKVSKEIKDIADSMSEKELEDFASTSHDKLPEKVHEALEIMESEQKYHEMADSTGTVVDDKEPMRYPGFLPSNDHSIKDALTPSYFKLPMGKPHKKRRLMDWDEFLRRINYKTHDGILQRGHGQNIASK